MAFKIRRGYDSERLTITPAEGELIYTVDTKNLYVGDGATVGGILVGSSGSGGGGGLQGVQGIQGLEGPQGLPGGGGGGGDLSNVTTDIIPDTDVTYNIGSPSKKFKDLYLSSDTIYLGEKSLSVKDNKLELGGVRFGFNGNVNGFVSATWNANTVVIRAETNSPADSACQNIVIGDKLKLDNDPNYVGISVLNVSSAPSAALDELDPVFIDFTFNVDATSVNPDTSISFELVKPIGSPSITSLLDPDGLLPDVSVPGWPYYEVPLGVNVLVGDTNVSIIPSWDRQIVSFDFTESGVLKLPLGGDIQDQEGNSLLTQGSSAQGIQGAQGTQGLQGTTAGPTYNITYDSDNNTYLISGYPNASLYLLKGFTYYFNVNAPGYPVFIKTEPTSGLDNVYANGVINNGTDNGTIEFTVPLNSPDTLYYVNIVNPNMNGLLTLSETGLQGLPGQSIQGIQGIAGPSGIDGISFVYLGSFDPDITYELNQVVFWEGSSYVFISNTPANGQYPTYSDPPLVNDLFWGILTSKGVQGIQGTNGVDGIDGGQGLQGIPGQDGSQGLQGTEGTSIIYRGDYNPTYPYYPNDIVSYLGNSYIFVNINSSIGQDPAYGDPPATNFNYWNPISARGAQGIQGEQGIQGIQGIQGDIGLSGASFYWAGTWDNTVEYYPNDVVFYNGSSYIATAVSINTDPELVAGAWNIISQKGSVGAQGEIGAQGVQGVQGSVGQGFRIAKIFSSLANLEADTGAGIAPGEFVLIDTGDPNNSDNSKLYVWNGSSYSFVTDLSGAVGIQGTEGSIGPVGPQGPIGIGTTWRGEWDLNTEYTKNDIISFVNSSYIYVNNTPSTGNVPIYLSTSIINADYWNLISRQGEIGLQGTQGIQGEQGFQGVQGVQGMYGQTGFQGFQGTSGPEGPIGFSGEQGIQGITGEAGVAGEQGIQGTTGITGNQGIQGIQGVGFNYLGAYDPGTTYNKNDVIFYQGSSFIFVNLASTSNELPLVGDPLVLNDFYWNYLSNQGIQGIVGDTGPQGEPGIQGIQGTSGVDGMSGAQGIQGVGFNYRDGYDSSVEYSKNDVVSYNGSSYIYTFSQPTTGNEPAFGNSGTTNTLYWSIVSSQGIQGIQGTDGFQGIQGEQGVQGVQGVQGEQGVQGVQGEQGIQGIQGIQGEKGEQGAQGEQGPIGLTGPEGLLGAQGIQGPQGTQGIQGEQGVQGIQGEQGFQGVQGIQGESIQGIQGEQGIQGAQGVQGIQGVGSDPLTAVASNILPDIEGTYNIGSDIFRFKDLYLSSNKINLFPSSFVIEPSGNTKIETRMGSFAGWTTTGEVVFYVDNLIDDEDDRILKLKKGDTINVQTANQTLPSTPLILTLTGSVTGAGVPYNDPDLGQGISYTVPVSLSASQLTFFLNYSVSQYHVTSADQLLDPTGLLGSQGIQGIQGLDGPSGGPQGVQGIQGATGITGNQGVQGVQGIAGEYAGQGIQGIQGATGITGNQGVQGVQGIAGEYAGQGIQGIQGEQGIQGIQGIQSADGAQGIQGVQGIQGADGPTSNTLSNGSYTVALGNTGSIIYPGEVTQSHKYGTTCPQNVDTVVYTATGDLQNAIKLFVIIEGLAGGFNYDTQACDVIAVKGNNSNIVYVTTYGVTYSSAAAFATFDGRLNPVTNRIEITCRPTSTTNPVYVGVHAIEITSID